MGHVLKDRCRPWFLAAVAALACAGAAPADTTPPQLVGFSVSSQLVDTSSGPAPLIFSITAQDAANGFNGNSAGNGSLTLALAGGFAVFTRQGLPIAAGTSVSPFFQFTLTLPQFTTAGVYAISLTLVDNASNTASFTSANLAALGFPSSITVTESAFGTLALRASTANVAAAGATGSVGVTTSNNGFAWTAVSNAPWLTISGASGTGSGSFSYTAAPNASPTPRTGIVTVGGQTFTVIQAGAGSVLSATQSSLQFVFQTGVAPQPQTFTAFSTGIPLNFTATASSAGNWLFVSPATGVTSAIVSVFVNPDGLASGTYTGAIVLTSPASSNGSQTVPVTLTVNGSQLVAASPASLSFSYQQGGSIPASQLLSLTAAAATSVGASASSTGSWLAVTPSSATTPSTLTVSISPAGLAPATYGGSIVLSTSAGTQNVPVTLVVSASTSLAVNPASLAFSYTIGAAVPVSQTLTVSGGAAGLSFSATASSTGNWLALGAPTGTVPGSLSVSVNPSGLAAGSYTGMVTLTAAGQSPQNLIVGLTVSLAAFSVSPSSLTFSLQPGSTVPVMQTLTISSSQTGAVFTATAQQPSGSPAWLSTAMGSFAAGTLQVTANPVNLVRGTYTGSILITGAAGSQSVPVTAIAGTAPSLTAFPAFLNFVYPSGGAIPPSQNATVTINGTGLTFSATPTSAGGWLSAIASNPSNPNVLTVSVNPSGLAPGTYNGSIVLAIIGFSTQQTLPVTLTVTGTSAFTASPTSFAVNYQSGDPIPNGQVFTLSGTTSSFTATTSSTGNWLSVRPTTGSIPTSLSAGISPAGLAAGAYTGTISITAPGAVTQTVTVTLNVVSPQSLKLTPASLAFSAAAGGSAPATQNITVACPNSALSFAPTASSTGNWLSVSVPSVIGNNQIVVAVNPSGLSANTYQGAINIVGIGACGSTQIVPVTLTVSTGAESITAAPVLSFGAGSLTFSATAGGTAAAPQTVSLNCSSYAATFTILDSSNGGWLTVSPLSGIAPQTVTVTANPGSLPAGTYVGSIVASSATCGVMQALPVTFVINSANSSPVSSPIETLSVTPSSFAFNYQIGGSPPLPQRLSLAGDGTVPFSIFVPGASWLSINPPSGTAPASLIVSVNPTGLAAGTYSASLAITYGEGSATATQSATVTLIVAPATSTAPAPITSINPLAFTYQLGGLAPATQPFVVSSPAGSALAAAASSAGGWLSVSPASATVPVTLTVAVDPTGLTVGSYSGFLIAGSQTVPVTLQVTAGVPFIGSLVNGASLLGGLLAPGEIIAIFGTGLGPATGVSAPTVPGGVVANSLGGTQVLIGGVAAPVLYAQDGLIGAIVPYEVAGQTIVPVGITYQGVPSAPATFAVTAVSPAIFTYGNSGQGQATILNQDGSQNASSNPASRGSTVTLYALGAGQVNPPSADGAIVGAATSQPVAPVSILVDGQPAAVSYAGDVQGGVSGVLQVNFQVPQQASAGSAVSVQVIVGPGQSQPGVTMAIQ